MDGYDLDTAREEMESIREIIENTPTVFFNKRVNKTITIGIAENDSSFKEPEDVIRLADERMYYGKQHGKNIVIYKSAY